MAKAVPRYRAIGRWAGTSGPCPAITPRVGWWFEEGGHAGRFWIIQRGTVALDMQVPDRRPPVVETLGVGDLVGWSWLCEPYAWQLGASAVTQVQAYEFDAVAVRLLCLDDAEFGQTVEHWVGRVLAHRLNAARALLVGLRTTDETEGL